MPNPDAAEATTNRPRKTTKILLSRENDRLRRHAESWEAIGAIASRLSRAQPFEAVLNEAARECAQSLSASIFCVFLLDEENRELRLTASVGLAKDDVDAIPVQPGEAVEDAARRGLPDWILRQGGTACASAETASPYGRTAFLPLAFREIGLGAICVNRPDDGESFDETEMKILVSIANQIAIGAFLEGPARQMMVRERAERDLHFAHTLKRKTLSEAPPEVDGWRFGLCCFRALEPRGDFHDFIPLPGVRLALLVGECTGWGVQAAMNVTHIIGRARSRLAAGESPEEAVAALNRHLVEHGQRGLLVSLCLMGFDPGAREAHIVRAGNTRVIQVTGGTPSDVLEENGTPLGVLSECAISVATIRFEAGDSLVVATDGLNKCGNATSLPELLARCDGSRPAQPGETPLADRLASALRREHEEDVVEDDITLLSLECLD